jgi:MSHA pilin protein MshD
MVIGIVLLSIVLSVLSTLFYPQSKQSLEPIYSVRASELANALLNEIVGKPFDENSGAGGNLNRCDEAGSPACSGDASVAALGPDNGENNVNLFDDIDDYHGYTQNGAQIASGAFFNNLYVNFSLSVTVGYDADFDGVFDDPTQQANRSFKLIKVRVTTPSNQSIDFAAYRGNY